MSYREIQERLCRGWNTWNTWSVLSHVLLPDGVAVNLSLKEYRSGRWLREALIGRRGENDEVILPGPHAYDGSYTELTLIWQDIELCIQSAHTGPRDMAMLITPIRCGQRRAPVLMVDMGILWKRPGSVSRQGDTLCAVTPQGTTGLFATGTDEDEVSVASMTPGLTMKLSGPVGLSTGRRMELDEIRKIIGAAKERVIGEQAEQFGERWLLEETFDLLYRWNEWFFAHRHYGNGMMAYGSDPYEPVTGNEWELNGVDDRFGGALESGLDNSPMYDDVPFDKERHILCQADVGLTGLYAMDCRALAEIAAILGRAEEEKALRGRLKLVSEGIQRMGLFMGYIEIFLQGGKRA